MRQPLSTSFSREIDIRILRESETPSSSDLEMGEIERRVKGYLVSVVVQRTAFAKIVRSTFILKTFSNSFSLNEGRQASEILLVTTRLGLVLGPTPNKKQKFKGFRTRFSRTLHQLVKPSALVTQANEGRNGDSSRCHHFPLGSLA